MKCKTTLTIVLFLFSLILAGYAQADEQVSVPKAPDKPEEPTVELKSSKFQKTESEEAKKDEDILSKLAEEMNKLEEQYKASPEESEEAQNFMERIKAIQKRMREIRAKSQRIHKRRVPRDPYQFLQNRIDHKRGEIEKLEDQIASARRHISEMKEKMTEDYPEVKEIERRIRHLQRKLDFNKGILEGLLERRRYLNPQKQRPESVPLTSKIPEAYLKAILNSRIEIFQISHVEMNYLVDLIKPFLTPEIGVVVPCTHTNSIIVRDTEKILKQVAEIVEHVDVPKIEVEKRREK